MFPVISSSCASGSAVVLADTLKGKGVVISSVNESNPSEVTVPPLPHVLAGVPMQFDRVLLFEFPARRTGAARAAKPGVSSPASKAAPASSASLLMSRLC